jgi:hypothetical protein
LPEEIKGQSFGLLTAQLDEKVTRKLSQFKGLALPSLIAIASRHFGAPLVLDALAAEYALSSLPYWRGASEKMFVDFKSSLFLRDHHGILSPKNLSISAIILLISVCADRSFVCGALHPAPKYRLDSKLLWEIPFAYLACH